MKNRLTQKNWVEEEKKKKSKRLEKKETRRVQEGVEGVSAGREPGESVHETGEELGERRLRERPGMKPLEVFPGPVPPPKGHSERGVGTRRPSGCRVMVSPGVCGTSVGSSSPSPSSFVLVVVVVVVVGDGCAHRYRRVLVTPLPVVVVPGNTPDSVGKSAEGGSARVSGISGSPELIYVSRSRASSPRSSSPISESPFPPR